MNVLTLIYWLNVREEIDQEYVSKRVYFVVFVSWFMLILLGGFYVFAVLILSLG